MTETSSWWHRLMGPLLPYGACLVAAWVLIPFTPDVRVGEVLLAVGLQLVVGAALVWRGWWRERGGAVVAGIVVFSASVWLLRNGVGKTAGGYGSLVLLPVIWAAVRARRAELAVAVGAAVVVMLGPLILIGGVRYPSSGWRGAVVLIVIAGVLGATVLALVDRVSASERLHRLLADTATDLVVRFSLDGTVLYASPAAFAVLGYQSSELVGQRLDRFWHPDDAGTREAHFGRSETRPGPSTMLYRMRHKDGRWLWFESTTAAVQDESGEVLGHRSAIRDVTERTEAAAEHAALSRLATLVATAVGPEAVFSAVADEIAQLFDSSVATVVRFDADAGVGTLVGAWTRERGRELTGSALDLTGQTAAAHVYRDRRALRIDYPTDGSEPLVEDFAVTTAICAPVFVMGELWGCVVAASANRHTREKSEARLARFAELVALTISHTESWNALARRATTDALTGLANRGVLDERLNEELERGRRHGIPLSLALFDIDHFKKVNDTHGHQTGDEVLVQVAQLIAAQARTGEVVARIGGEEFAWLMPLTDIDGACVAAERARQAVESLAVNSAGPLTVSAGVSCTVLAATARQLMATADRALYCAKETGRNIILPFANEMQADPR